MSEIDQIKKNYDHWVNEIYDASLTKKLVAMRESEILDAFGAELSFGTAGLRGVMGLGTNRINEITITRTAISVVKYLKENFENPSLVIGFDTRKNSKKFSRIFAKVSEYSGIKTYLFKKFCPTPLLSYSITNLKVSMGVMITASHNNKTYNGIKVSDHNGIQISGDTLNQIIQNYKNANGISVYNKTYKLPSWKNNKIKLIKGKMRKKFLSYGEEKKEKHNIKIVYTPLNGTGYKCVKKLLGKNNFDIFVPKTQKNGNGEFATCPYPNPEFEEAFCEAKKLAVKKNADIIVATDPDADRLGIMVKNGEDYTKISGNELGYIFLYQRAKQNKDKNAFAINSVVTSPLADDIAKHFNVKMQHTLTGFKNLGKKMYEQIALFGKQAYVLAYEESCGYILRDDMYDKDGIFATLEICKIADNLKKQNKTILDLLNEIYATFGYLANLNFNDIFEGNNAQEKLSNSIQKLRQNLPTSLAEEKIEKVIDYLNDNTGFEKQNFIELRTKNVVAIVRPSGTEPKLKYYIFAKSNTKQQAEEMANNVYTNLKEIVS